MQNLISAALQFMMLTDNYLTFYAFLAPRIHILRFFLPFGCNPFPCFFFFLLLFYFLSFFFSYLIRDFNITYTQIFIYEYPALELLQLMTMWDCSFWQFLQTKMLGSWRKIFWRNLYIRRNEGILHRNNQVVIRHKKYVC